MAPVDIGKVTGKAELFDCLENLVDIIVDDGSDPGYQVSTILELTGQEPNLIRQGLGVETVTAMIG